MSFRELLDFHLIQIKDVSVTVGHFFIVIIILITTWLVIRIVSRIFKRAETRQKMDVGTSHAIFQIIKYVLWVIAISLALDTIGLPITIFLASSAALLVGLGLGLQQIFQDFISGITLIMEGSLKVGDIIQTADGQVGRVKQINMRTSKVETRDNIIMIVPNSKLINEVVVNWSHIEKKTRFNIEVGVAYGSDVELVRKVLLKCAHDHDSVSSDPKPSVRFSDFSDSSLNFTLLFYSLQTFRVEDIKSDIRFMIDAAFRENNIRIPFPQRDVHFYDKKIPDA